MSHRARNSDPPPRMFRIRKSPGLKSSTYSVPASPANRFPLASGLFPFAQAFEGGLQGLVGGASSQRVNDVAFGPRNGEGSPIGTASLADNRHHAHARGANKHRIKELSVVENSDILLLTPDPDASPPIQGTSGHAAFHSASQRSASKLKGLARAIQAPGFSTPQSLRQKEGSDRFFHPCPGRTLAPQRCRHVAPRANSAKLAALLVLFSVHREAARRSPQQAQ